MPHAGILNNAQFLSEEYSQIWEPRQFSTEAEYQQAVYARKQAALCLSGGGIRSASFSLSASLRPSRERVFCTKFQFLSTVSGGGYTGGWLWRWISDAKGKVAEVASALSSLNEPPQVQALREGASFLTPKTRDRFTRHLRLSSSTFGIFCSTGLFSVLHSFCSL